MSSWLRSIQRPARDAFCDVRSKDGRKEWHELSLNTQWLGSDKDGNLHCATAYCFHCGRHFEIKEFRVDNA